MSVEQTAGMSLEQLSALVETLGREAKTKQALLQPLINELKVCRAMIPAVHLINDEYTLAMVAAGDAAGLYECRDGVRRRALGV